MLNSKYLHNLTTRLESATLKSNQVDAETSFVRTEARHLSGGNMRKGFRNRAISASNRNQAAATQTNCLQLLQRMTKIDRTGDWSSESDQWHSIDRLLIDCNIWKDLADETHYLEASLALGLGAKLAVLQAFVTRYGNKTDQSNLLTHLGYTPTLTSTSESKHVLTLELNWR